MRIPKNIKSKWRKRSAVAASQPFETIRIGQANTLGKINIQPDRIFLDTMVSVVTADFVRPAWYQGSSFEDGQRHRARAAEAYSIHRHHHHRCHSRRTHHHRFSQYPRIEIDTSGHSEGKIQNQVQKAQPIVIEKISVSQNIQYPREVLEALENEKKVLLGQRAKVAEENIKNLINQKRVESEIINRTNLAQTDRSILEQFNELFANDPKRAARYILLMRYAHEAGRAVDGAEELLSHEIIALVDQLNHQLDDGPKPVNKTHPN